MVNWDPRTYPKLPRVTVFPVSQVHRMGRARALSPTQQALMDDLFPQLQLSMDTPFVQQKSPVWLEIGFGKGEHLAEQAQRNPAVLFIGCEPFLNGLASLLVQISQLGLTNIRLVRDDARLLINWLPTASISRIDILFPDPWPKKRHNKRRIIQAETVAQLYRILKPSGLLTVATDHRDYLDEIQNVFAQYPAFENDLDGRQSIFERPRDWIPTRYEEKAILKGIQPAYLCFKRSK